MLRTSPLGLPRPDYMVEEMQLFEEAVDRFIDQECVDHIEHWAKAGEVPRDTWRKAGQAGLLMASAPE
ncbi:MAG: acyl-CoA dehydrogenase family protein, partial [Sphingomonadaceae bacterium]|nr:acyl-CoA dehydrogenase family protein [Sphingomonadaceae bacterium]